MTPRTPNESGIEPVNEGSNPVTEAATSEGLSIEDLGVTVGDSAADGLRSALPEDKLFERSWAETLVETALERLAAAYTAEGKQSLFDRLQTFLAVGAEPLPSYSELAARLAATESTIRSHVTRLRARYREMLRAEVRRTVATESEVDEELRELLRVLVGK